MFTDARVGDPCLELSFKALFGAEHLETTKLRIYKPEIAVEGFSQAILHVCPYWNREKSAICFWERDSGKDLNMSFNRDALSSPKLRPLGELAVAEGHLTSLLGPRLLCTP